MSALRALAVLGCVVAWASASAGPGAVSPPVETQKQVREVNRQLPPADTSKLVRDACAAAANCKQAPAKSNGDSRINVKPK